MFIFTGNTDLTWLWGALIGVVSVIMGAFLGWFLTKPRDKELMLRIREINGPVVSGVDDTGQLIRGYFYFEIIVYNSSDFVKSINNLKLEVLDDNAKIVLAEPIFNLDDTDKVGIMPITYTVDIANFLPKYTKRIRCNINFYYNDLKNRDSFSKYRLSYSNEKNKTITVPFEFFDLKSIDLIKQKDEK